MQKAIFKISSIGVKLLVFNLIIILFPLILEREVLVLNLYLIFIAQTLTFGIEIYKLSANNKISLYSLLSPSFICVFYISVSFAAGSYTSSRGMGLNGDYLFLPQKMDYFKTISFFFLLTNFLVFQIFRNNAIKHYTTSISLINAEPKKNHNLKIFLLIILHLILFNFSFDWTRLGIGSGFNYPFLVTTSIILFFLIADRKPVIKYSIYALILVLYTKFNFESKREILYILMLIIFFELVHRPSIKLHLKQISIFASIGLLAVTIIIVSSVYRGYGSVDDATGVVETVSAASQYIGSDIFKDALVENFELNTSFCNAFNSVEMVLQEKIEFQYGLSFLRIFLLPIPASLIPWKPDRIIIIYTSAFAPTYYANGGSLPPTFYSEAFINFHYFSILFIIFIFYIFDAIFYFASKRIMKGKLNTLVVLSVFSSITAMQFIRGSSIDLYFIYIMFALPFSLLIIWFTKLKIKSSHRISLL